MTWVNLNDVYVKNTGGTINGDLDVNGAITVNDGSGNGTKYNVANEISTLRDSVSQALTKVAYGGESGLVVVDTSSWSYGFYYIAAFVPYPNSEDDMFDALVLKDNRGDTHLTVLHGKGTLTGSVIKAELSWYSTITRMLLSRS